MFKKIDSNLYDVLLSITAFLLLIAVLLTFYQVVTRFVFDSPTPWSEILARGVIIWAVFLGLPCVVRYGELISIDIIYKLFNAHHYLIKVMIQILNLIVFVIIFKYGIEVTFRVVHQTVPLLDFSMSWLYASIPVGTGLSIFTTLLRLIDIRELNKHEEVL